VGIGPRWADMTLTTVALSRHARMMGIVRIRSIKPHNRRRFSKKLRSYSFFSTTKITTISKFTKDVKTV
jgi:hypothetical protein